MAVPAAEDLRAGIVVETGQRDAVKAPESALVAIEDDIEPLVRIGARPEAARVAEGEDEEMRDRLRIGNPQTQLAEIHLGLLARAGLEPHRGHRRPLARRAQRLPVALHLQVAAAEAQAVQLAVQDGPVPADLGRPFFQERRARVERPPAGARRPRPPGPAAPPRLHRLAIHGQLARDVLDAFPSRQARQDLFHHVLS